MNKFFEIFKSGKHTDSSGHEINFSDDDVEKIAKNYNPAIHEAPIVIGHPKTNAPAFGWIKGLVFDAAKKALKAIPSQMNTDFVEAVKNGAYKKISASFYSPDSPNNPTPGQYALRHVGFLGAQPPAIKGLEAVEFAEDDQTIEMELDFSEFDAAWNDKYISRVLRSLKNFLIDKFSQEDADAAIPEWELEGINTSAERAIAKDEAKESDSSFSESKENKELEAERQKSAALEAKLARIEAEKVSAANAEFCETLIKEGRLLPALQSKVLAFMNSLENTEIEFSETEKGGNLDFFKKFLQEMPVQVDFSEVTPTPSTDAEDLSDPHVLATKAVEYKEERAKAGQIITISEAVRFVKG